MRLTKGTRWVKSGFVRSISFNISFWETSQTRILLPSELLSQILTALGTRWSRLFHIKLCAVPFKWRTSIGSQV